MSVIWKYDLNLVDEQVLEMPAGAQVLAVQQQAGALAVAKPLQLWALVDPEEPRERRFFHIIGTGNPVPRLDNGESLTHLATVVTAGGALVWHVFELAYVSAP